MKWFKNKGTVVPAVALATPPRTAVTAAGPAVELTTPPRAAVTAAGPAVELPTPPRAAVTAAGPAAELPTPPRAAVTATGPGAELPTPPRAAVTAAGPGAELPTPPRAAVTATGPAAELPTSPRAAVTAAGPAVELPTPPRAAVTAAGPGAELPTPAAATVDAAAGPGARLEAPARPSTATPVLPCLLRVRPTLSNTTGYVISPDDILAAIKEEKSEFIELMLSSHPPSTEVTTPDMLFKRLNELAAFRLTAYLEYAIRDEQQTIITRYKKDRTATNPISIPYLNTLIAATTSIEDPLYATITANIYDKYLNQLQTYLQEGDAMQCNHTSYTLNAALTNLDLRRRIAGDVAAFLAHCRTSFKFEFSSFESVNLDATIRALNAKAVEAKKRYDKSTKSYNDVVSSLEQAKGLLESNKQKLDLFAANFAAKAPSTFSAELARRDISPAQADFKRKLAQIFLASSVDDLQIYLFHAVKIGAEDIVNLLLRECVSKESNPLPHLPDYNIVVDSDGNTIFHIMALKAQSADTPATLDKVLRMLKAILDTVKTIARNPESDVIIDDSRLDDIVNHAFLLENSAAKTVMELLLEANRFKLFLMIRTYITPQLIAAVLRARPSEFEDRISKHLLAYEAKLRAFEDKPATRAILDTKCADFSDSAKYPDKLYDRLMQRRKALESLWVALWITSITGSDKVLRDQTRRCGEMSVGYSEPDDVVFSRNTLTTPLLAILGDYMTGTKLKGQARVSTHYAAAAGAGISLATASVSSEAYSRHSIHGRASSAHRAERTVISSTGMTTEDVALSIQLEKLFSASFAEPSVFVSLDILREHKSKLTGFHLDIYNLILEAYEGSTSSAAYFFFARPTYYSTANWDLQRKHISRMTEALTLIARYPRNSIYDAQLTLINNFLLDGLKAMAHDLRWVSPAAFLYTDVSPLKPKLLEIKADETAVILSVEAAAEKTIAQLRADMAKDRATAAAETAAARASAAADIAAVQTSAATDKAAYMEEFARLKAMIAASIMPSNAAGLGAHGVFAPAAPPGGAATSAAPIPSPRPS